MSLTEGISLRVMMNRASIGVPTFLHIAIALTERVHAAHKQHKLMGRLNSSTIQIHSESNITILQDNRVTDFAYLSPEQTGRINHTPDKRSDLYALGVIFYEMLAGKLPFQAKSTEELIHAHIAIVPTPLRELRSEMEGSLDSIVMKLLSKRPEERYQNAYGLLCDLRSCALSIEERGEITPFEIAQADEASRFRLPRNLFGRETEEQALQEAFEQACIGESSFVFVSGSAGSGKTTLVRELQEPVRRAGGRFIGGKCDLMNRDIPFSPILQALRRLIDQVCSESPDNVTKLKMQLTEALGQGAAVIVQLLPEAAKLLGEIPSMKPLPPGEAAVRFHLLVPTFMKIFADKEHPLVIFLDDLQWADPATMDVLRTIAHAPNRQGLLVIGTFREESTSGWADNGVGQAAATIWIEESLALQQERASRFVQHIWLDALTYIEVRQFISYVLNENSARVRSLAEVLYHRTGGNPLYMHRLLDSLYREEKLYYDEEASNWAWDATVVTRIPEDPDILHLIGARIRMLSADQIELLTIGAAIGHRFHPNTLSLVSGRSLLHTRQIMRLVEEEGLLVRENDTEDGYYTFLHDRVQQAAYMALTETEKANLHLTIGRVMRDHSFDEREYSIFEKVHHLNLGSDRMEDEAEKRALAEYNYQAGLKSKATTAFAAALRFFELGLSLAGDDWSRTSSLSYRLMLELPECEYMCRRVDRAEELLDRLMSCTTDLIERSHIYLIRIAMNAYLKNDEIAVHIGQQALAEFGWHFPRKPSRAIVIKEVAMTHSALLWMRKEIPKLRVNRTPHYKALSDLVMAISMSVFIISVDLSVVLFSRFIRYGLKHGSNEAFAFTLGGYGMVLYKTSSYRTGPQYIDMAFHLSSSFESADLQSRLHYIRGLVMLNDPDQGIKQLEQAIQYGMESANLTYVSIAMLTITTVHTGDLHTLSARITNYEEISQHLVDEVTRNIFRIAMWYVVQMQDGAGERDDFVNPLRNDQFKESLNNEVYYTCTCQIEIAYLFGRYLEALEWAEKGKFNTHLQTRIQVRKQQIYKSLTLAAMYAEAPLEERKNIRVKLRKQLRAMKQWSGYYRKNGSAYLLLTAELLRIEGNRVAAAKGYDEAIQVARSEGRGLMEAISCERASTFYRESGSITGADILMEDACAAYSKWGATAKVRRLRETNAELRKPQVEFQEGSVTVTGAEHLGQKDRMREARPLFGDEKMLIRQMTEWSSTGDRSNVMNKFLEAAILYSGAEKGYVLNSHEEGFSIEGQAGPMDDHEVGNCCAEAIVRYVVMTSESIVLADASHSSYAADSYIIRSKSQSVLCMPILFPGVSLPSVLYLENNLISDVFTKERLEVLDLMIARMVYLKSLEDSRIETSVSIDSENGTSSNSFKAPQHPLAERLTSRETEILYALTDGLSNKEIAYRFGLTEGTVKSYVYNLYGKLGVKRRSQAIARAKELMLVSQIR